MPLERVRIVMMMQSHLTVIEHCPRGWIVATVLDVMLVFLVKVWIILEAVIVRQGLEVVLFPCVGRVKGIWRNHDPGLGLAVSGCADVAAVSRLDVSPVAVKNKPVLKPVLTGLTQITNFILTCLNLSF